MNEDIVGPAVAIDHHHGAGEDHTLTVVDLMSRMGVDCARLGFHRHSRPNSPSVMHHHHDLRCLIEAGANSVLPDLRVAERKVVSLTRDVDTYKAEQQVTSERLDQANNQVEMMLAFMDAMPSTGPWKTVHEAWLDWKVEHYQSAGRG